MSELHCSLLHRTRRVAEGHDVVLAHPTQPLLQIGGREALLADMPVLADLLDDPIIARDFAIDQSVIPSSKDGGDDFDLLSLQSANQVDQPIHLRARVAEHSDALFHHPLTRKGAYAQRGRG